MSPVWQPEHGIELVAGTPAGGGQDRPARALIGILEANKLVNQPIKLTNIPGRGGGNGWDYLRTQAGNPHVLAINSPTVITNRQLGEADFDHRALTPLANLYTEYIAFVVRADSPIRNAADFMQRLADDSAGCRIALATAIGKGDAAARDHMIRANLRLVVNIARGYSNRGLALPDLIEEGNLGLLRAVEGFDPTMGTRFSTYASYWIKQSIKRALINSGKTIRIPAYMVELLSKWRRATARLSDALGRTPTSEEVARMLGLARKKLPIIKKAIHVQQNAPQTEQAEGGWSLGELIRDENAKCPAEVLLDHDTLRHVMQRIEGLNERAAKILRLRFGLGGGEPMTLKDIGAVLGLTRERVRQIESETLANLAAAIDGVPRATIRLRHGA